MNAATQFYGPASVYGITPVTEAMARAVAKSNIPQPVARWQLPAAPTPDTPKVCLNCGHDTPHTEDAGTDVMVGTPICGWQRVASDSQPIFRCDCIERDLGEPKEYDFEAEDLDVEEDVLL